LIEPFGAGGGPDLLGRALARKLSVLWSQPVTVENVTGAGATAGPAKVASAPADGYTLLINTNAQAYSAAFATRLPYDPLKDFVPVAPLTSQPYVLVAGKLAGLASVSDLVALAKAKPGELKFGSTGVGTATHIGAEKFNLAAGIKAIHAPPRPSDSNADMITNVIAGRTTYCFAPISLGLPQLRNGNLVALGVSTTRRSILLPEVPTIAEAGVATFDFPIWYGIWVRAGTPPGVIDRLARDFGSVLIEPDMRDWIAQHGAEVMTMTQPEFTRFVLSESESAAATVKAAGIELQ
jgi:tripartite-type tricarboxylate transporter receptor subunit TctC